MQRKQRAAAALGDGTIVAAAVLALRRVV